MGYAARIQHISTVFNFNPRSLTVKNFARVVVAAILFAVLMPVTIVFADGPMPQCPPNGICKP